jgi:hypothetical protein
LPKKRIWYSGMALSSAFKTDGTIPYRMRRASFESEIQAGIFG